MSPERVQARVAAIAARRHGVISSDQLRRAGLAPRAISHWANTGRLHRIHRGVYAVGHTGLSNEGRWAAAVLACGAGAVASHRDAAEIWAMLKVRGGPVHVTVPRRGGRRSRKGIYIHRSSSLPNTDVTRHRGIPVTTPARTIADLRQTEPAYIVRRATRQAEYQGLPLAGVKTDHSRSELERRFLRLCRSHKLPEPEVNAEMGIFKADFLWRERRLVVETDGWQAHRGRQAFLDDRERDAYFRLKGFDVLRFSDAQVSAEQPVVALLRRYLDA